MTITWLIEHAPVALVGCVVLFIILYVVMRINDAWLSREVARYREEKERQERNAKLERQLEENEKLLKACYEVLEKYKPPVSKAYYEEGYRRRIDDG